MRTTGINSKHPTKEDFLAAKQVVEGKLSSGNSAQQVFNNTFKWLEKHISRTYKLQDESFLNEDSTKDYTYKIIMPRSFYKEESSSQSDNENYNEADIEISIGEFILVSLRTWNPEKAEYLTYIRYLLQNCKWRVKKDIATDKVRAIRNARRLIINKYNLPTDSSDEEVLRAIMHSRTFSAEQKETYMYILSKNASLYTPISAEKDGENSTRMIDFIQGKAYEQPDLEPSDSLENVINIYHQAFLKTQARTRPCLIVYITVEIYKALYKQNTSIQNYFASKYPDMIDTRLFQWVDETIQRNMNEMNSNLDKQIEAAYPSSRQQAEKAGKEQHSYLNITKRFKNSVKDSMSAT